MASDIRLNGDWIVLEGTCQVNDSITVSEPGVDYLPGAPGVAKKWSVLTISNSDILVKDFVKVFTSENPQPQPTLIEIFTMRMMMVQIRELYKTINDLKERIDKLEGSVKAL